MTRLKNYAHLIYGYDKKVMTRQGKKRYVNLDNAASTPPFLPVIEKILHDAAWYSSVHRGAGYKSIYSTEEYEKSREIIGNFTETDLERDVVIFTKNTTDALNKFHHYLPFLPGEIIIYTRIEHHSNELPWQDYPHHFIQVKNNSLDLEALESYLKKHRGQVKLVAVSGASNVTGYTPPLYTIAEMAHTYGAKILVDGAQLVPHHPVKKKSPHDPQHLDFLAFSGHKMYAPFGSGVLIGSKKLFSKGIPSQVGGGTLKGIGPSGIIWSNPPENEEAGSPNVIGAIAIAEACRTINRIGWQPLIQHEQQLIDYALPQLSSLPGITIYNTNHRHRVGVITFNLDGINHQHVAQYLSEELGIGVRSGCFCARRYVLDLLKTNFNYHPVADPGHIPGMVRISFGCYNTTAEIDLLVTGLRQLLSKKTVIKETY